MSDHEAAGVGETPPTAENDDQDRYEPTSEDIEQVADGVIRYYFDLGELSDEQTQALGEARYKEIRLTDDEIDAMKAEIRGRVSGSVVLAEPTLPYNDPPPSADAAHGEEWNVNLSDLTDDEAPAEEDIDAVKLLADVPPKGAKFGRTMAIAIVTLELYGPSEDKMHQMNRNGLRMNGSAVQDLSPDKTQVITADGKSHPYCTGNDPDETTYYAPHSQQALEAMRGSAALASGYKLKEIQLRALSPEDTVEIFKRAKQQGEEVSFRDLVAERIFSTYGEHAAQLANEVTGGALMIAYDKAIKDSNGSQRDEVIDAMEKADKKKSNGSKPAPSDAGPVEDSNSPGKPANPQERKSVKMKTQQSPGTQADPRPPVTIRHQGDPLPQATDLLAQSERGVTEVLDDDTQVRNARASDGPEGNFTTGELNDVERLCGNELKKLAALSKGTCKLNDEELTSIKSCLDANQPMPIDERTAIVAAVRARQPKPAWKKVFEAHKTKIPYAVITVLALVVAGLLISRPSDGSIANPAAATVAAEVRTQLELVGNPRASQASDGTWMVRVPVRVPADLNHGEWRTMNCSVSGKTVPPTAGQQPGLLVNGATYVRTADGKEKVEVVLTREGELDLSKMQVVLDEVEIASR